MSLALIVAFVAAIAGPLVTYTIAAKRFSGKIETSDAKDLWAESRSIRDWSQGRIATLTEDVRHLTSRVNYLEHGNHELENENRHLVAEVNALGVVITELRDEVRRLTEELEKARKGEA